MNLYILKQISKALVIYKNKIEGLLPIICPRRIKGKKRKEKVENILRGKTKLKDINNRKEHNKNPTWGGFEENKEEWWYNDYYTCRFVSIPIQIN